MPRNLARLAARLARANAAVEVLADGAERYLALRDATPASAIRADPLMPSDLCRHAGGNPASAAEARDRPVRS